MTDLEAAYFAARKAYFVIYEEQSAERARLTREMELALRARFGERLAAADAAQEKAKAAIDAGSVVAATTKHADKIGQEVFEWSRGGSWGRGRGGHFADYSLTGLRARYEIWTPDNVARGHAPEPGKLVLRVLKKDGTPSQRITYPSFRWLPEGQKP